MTNQSKCVRHLSLYFMRQNSVKKKNPMGAYVPSEGANGHSHARSRTVHRVSAFSRASTIYSPMLVVQKERLNQQVMK